MLGDGDRRDVWRCDAGEVEEVTQLEMLQGALIVGDGVDVELDPFELPSVKECEDGVAQPSLVGLGGHRSGSGGLEAEAISEVGVERCFEHVTEVIERGSPGGVGVLGRPGLAAQPRQQRLPTPQCLRAGGGDDHESREQPLVGRLLAQSVERDTGVVRALPEVCGTTGLMGPAAA